MFKLHTIHKNAPNNNLDIPSPQTSFFLSRTNNLNTPDISRCSVVSSKLTIFVFFCVPPFRCDVPFENKIITKNLKCDVFSFGHAAWSQRKKILAHNALRSLVSLFNFNIVEHSCILYFISPYQFSFLTKLFFFIWLLTIICVFLLNINFGLLSYTILCFRWESNLYGMRAICYYWIHMIWI